MANSNEIVFARVEQGQVIEYPVTAEQIRNRKAPLSMFKQVTAVNEKPELTPYQVLVEEVKLVGIDVRLTYSVKDLTIQEILNNLHETFEIKEGRTITVAEVPESTFNCIMSLTRAKLGKDLDAFAQGRDYDSILSLCSYATDPDPKHVQEAQRGVELRSKVWASIRDYQVAVATGEKPVPRFESEIFEAVPALTWE